MSSTIGQKVGAFTFILAVANIGIAKPAYAQSLDSFSSVQAKEAKMLAKAHNDFYLALEEVREEGRESTLQLFVKETKYVDKTYMGLKRKLAALSKIDKEVFEKIVSGSDRTFAQLKKKEAHRYDEILEEEASSLEKALAEEQKELANIEKKHNEFLNAEGGKLSIKRLNHLTARMADISNTMTAFHVAESNISNVREAGLSNASLAREVGVSNALLKMETKLANAHYEEEVRLLKMVNVDKTTSGDNKKREMADVKSSFKEIKKRMKELFDQANKNLKEVTKKKRASVNKYIKTKRKKLKEAIKFRRVSTEKALKIRYEHEKVAMRNK